MTDHGSLYGKIITRDGVLGLIAFVLIGFLIGVIYTGQLDNKAQLSEIVTEEKSQTEILKDIRYSLRENTGLTLRDTAR